MDPLGPGESTGPSRHCQIEPAMVAKYHDIEPALRSDLRQIWDLECEMETQTRELTRCS